MGEIMRPIPFGQLMQWALAEYKQKGSIFGIRKEKFWKPPQGRTSIFGSDISSPVGPAAGPNSQLAQNIIAAYLAGSRFMELKTVQKMDGEELRHCIPRPCISAEDEGYNVEWSTELTVPEAYDEYVKAWVALHALGAELGLSSGCDFVFNMSVGYDLEGIKTTKIDSYIEGMKDASAAPVFTSSLVWLRDNLAQFQHLTAAGVDAISPQVANSVTLSTLHGCPPAEIERIAKYLLEEKKVHTFVKCNPTLLGYREARRLLDEMGYAYVSFDEHHFNNDLQYPDAVNMLTGLMAYASERQKQFGVKITNTFPVQILKKELPGEEMYMSGRALLPLSIHVAAKLGREFGGKLPISYSGGADAFNLEGILKAGIRPVTVATTILKPGGYERLHQLASLAAPLLGELPTHIDSPALDALAEGLLHDAFYQKDNRPVDSRKTSVPLPLFDCFQAPCKEGGCPIEQQIPEYLRLVSKEQYDEAFRVIAIDNALPGLTGTICNHACQGKCTRLDYDHPLQIRSAKWLATKAAQSAFTAALAAPGLKTAKTVAVIGAGPAGIAAAHYLRRNGVAVTVFEKREKPFGIVEYVIPGFRIAEETLQNDYEMAVKLGATFQFGCAQNDPAALLKEYDFVILAVGAWKEGPPAVEEGKERTIDALRFLEDSKAGATPALGKRVAIVGGGDVAMDCARVAARSPGVEKATLVYRRTRQFMPADKEEIRLALEDGVDIVELHAPLAFDGSSLECEKMKLGDWDDSGRRGILPTGEKVRLPFDSVICAVGARVDGSLFEQAGLGLDSRGRPVLSAALESSLAGLYVAGDCKRGPSTIVSAMADAKAITKDILAKLSLPHDFTRLAPALPEAEAAFRKGILRKAATNHTDGSRCLGCDSLCVLCCDVCPNRANVFLPVAGFANPYQILHVDGMCNECGNCGVFCPHSGDPYKDKTTLFWTEEDFHNSQNRGFLKKAAGKYMIRTDSGEVLECPLNDPRVGKEMATLIQTVEEELPYILR